MTILSIPYERKEEFVKILRRHRCIDLEERIKEPNLNNMISSPQRKLWKTILAKMCLPIPPKDQSLSELELISIIKQFSKNVVIEEQYPVGNRRIDIKITYNGNKIYIDFLGPYHFEDSKIDEDQIRKAEIEEKIKSPLIEWPYWIQLCERNVRIAFGENLQGRGAIWGSEVFFGSSTEKVKNKIIDLSKKFNAIHNDGIGYFYELWEENGHVIKPAHPIIEMIKEGKHTIDKLLPANLDVEEKKFWLPKELWKLINQK